MESLYEIDGGFFLPHPLAVSPWNPRHQSGVSLAGLLTHLVEQAPVLAPMMLTRLTIDIIRPAPMGPLKGVWKVVREGRRIQNVDAWLEDDGVVVARISAVRIRKADTTAVSFENPYIPPEEAPERPMIKRRGSPLETRMIQGGPTQRGPGMAWGRPSMEVVPGVPFSYVAGAAMVADVGSAVAAILDGREWNFANTGLALHFFREPISDWILIDAQTQTAGNGLALVDAILADRRGPIGRARQTLFVDPATARAVEPKATQTVDGASA